MVPKSDDFVRDEIEKIRMQVRAIRDDMPGDSDIHETLDIIVGELSIALEDLR